MEHRTLIFGATGGIGAALARRLVGAGYAVHLAGRDPVRLAALADELRAPSSPCDVLDEAAVGRVVAAAGGALAGLAFCVGSIVLKPIGRATAADHLDAYHLNVVAAARAVALAAPALKVGRGAVVLVSSVAARAGFPNHSVIGPVKAAVEGLTVALAAELAPAVRVNCIAPSLTRTAMAAPLLANPAMAQSIAAQHPIPRLGEAEDVAALAAFLLGPDAGWITGQVFGIDGGRSTVRIRG
ncbi:SDR family NAD(P)-dependent oxidoreductase [Elioraea sp. Yellowstone]|uniref:SDR family NAD(P)-dependent oxidoreductase n=1 Tax=Elioraea sp. Yellowstone TaxID=2592070 RepID=UPI001F336DEB|nr:SDR family oxidoreductase [Elioraea sp. Yellowstone]